MADAKKEKAAKPRGGLLGVLIAPVLAVAFGAGGFAAMYFDLLGLPVPPSHEVLAPRPPPRDAPRVAFVPLTPILVSLGRGETLQLLQLTAELEIEPEAEHTVRLLTPRIVDVLNTYLRAVDAATVEDPASMLRMRAQMLRRVQVVVGEGMVRDLLVAEFILR
ncbi:MAG: flagellar basal body protein FliL [Rhodobacteraceae bacterium]|nr:MAG: flagellar basal body protein FliL [Paracoccaceae bacterium]